VLKETRAHAARLVRLCFPCADLVLSSSSLLVAVPWQYYTPYKEGPLSAGGTSEETGLDTSVQPPILDAIKNATRTGGITFSDRTPLAFSPTSQGIWGIIVTLPIFPNATQNTNVFGLSDEQYAEAAGIPPQQLPLPPVEERADALLGCITALVRVQTLLTASLNTLNKEAMQVQLFDLAVPANVSFIAIYNQQEDLSPDHESYLDFHMGGRPYRMTCTPTPGFVDTAYSSTPLILALLAAFVVFVNCLFVLVASVFLAAKRAVHRNVVLRQVDAAKTESLRILQLSQALAEQHTQSKTDFLSFLCHELRNPLHAVGSMVDFLVHSDSLLRTISPEDASSLETIEEQVKLMNSIVNDALDLSKIEAGKMVRRESSWDGTGRSVVIRSLMHVVCSLLSSSRRRWSPSRSTCRSSASRSSLDTRARRPRRVSHSPCSCRTTSRTRCTPIRRASAR
jgi:hypothetical protein